MSYESYTGVKYVSMPTLSYCVWNHTKYIIKPFVTYLRNVVKRV